MLIQKHTNSNVLVTGRFQYAQSTIFNTLRHAPSLTPADTGRAQQTKLQIVLPPCKGWAMISIDQLGHTSWYLQERRPWGTQMYTAQGGHCTCKTCHQPRCSYACCGPRAATTDHGHSLGTTSGTLQPDLADAVGTDKAVEEFMVPLFAIHH